MNTVFQREPNTGINETQQQKVIPLASLLIPWQLEEATGS